MESHLPTEKVNLDNLRKAISEAQQAAIDADPKEDGGSCNMDSVVIVLPRFRKSVADSLCLIKTHRPGRFYVPIDTKGQSARNTTMCESAAKKLQEFGYNAYVQYMMD